MQDHMQQFDHKLSTRLSIKKRNMLSSPSTSSCFRSKV